MKPQTLPEELIDLLCQALETESGGIKVYETALKCAVNEDLKEEWQEYLEQTRNHEQIMEGVFAKLGLDAGRQTPGRGIVREKAQGLIKSMQKALSAGKPGAAQLVACECVVEAETKDHLNWELIGEMAKIGGDAGRVLKEAHDEVEEEEDEHLYHTQGWCRELWLDSLGRPSVLPPPEEKKDVKTAIGAARAKQNRRPTKPARSKQARAKQPRKGNGSARSKKTATRRKGASSHARP